MVKVLGPSLGYGTELDERKWNHSNSLMGRSHESKRSCLLGEEGLWRVNTHDGIESVITVRQQSSYAVFPLHPQLFPESLDSLRL